MANRGETAGISTRGLFARERFRPQNPARRRGGVNGQRPSRLYFNNLFLFYTRTIFNNIFLYVCLMYILIAITIAYLLCIYFFYDSLQVIKIKSN